MLDIALFFSAVALEEIISETPVAAEFVIAGEIVLLVALVSTDCVLVVLDIAVLYSVFWVVVCVFVVITAIIGEA